MSGPPWELQNLSHKVELEGEKVKINVINVPREDFSTSFAVLNMSNYLRPDLY